MAGGNGVRIGIALGDREVVAVLLGNRGAPAERVSVSLEGGGPEVGPELLRAFGELKGALELASGGQTDGAAVHVALLPPLADARLVPFPPMKQSEAEAVLRRDVARYFLGANRPHVIGVRLPRRNGNSAVGEDGAFTSVLAAAAPLVLLEAIRLAVAEVGWRCLSFSAAHGSWLAAAVSSKGTPVASQVAIIGNTAHLLQLDGPNPVAVRQLPASDTSAISEVLSGTSGRVLVLSSPEAFEGLRGSLMGLGLSVSRDPEGWPGAEEGTAARAAINELELVPPTLAGERREKTLKTIQWMGASAAVLILAALLAQFWGVHRELQAVRERRASIQAEVSPLLLARDSLSGLVAQIQSMEELSKTSPVWTRSLVELAALLPTDTYLTGFFASGDTVELEASGQRAGEAIQALSEAGLFQEIRLQGLVERELEEGETVVETFRLWARLPEGGEGEGP